MVMFDPTRDATEILVGVSRDLPVEGSKVKVVALTQCNNSFVVWCAFFMQILMFPFPTLFYRTGEIVIQL